MREVWKFPIPTGAFALSLPMDWKVTSVDVQAGKPFVWILGDYEKPRHQEAFMAVATGEPIPEDADHLGTFHLRETEMGHLVFHLFVRSVAIHSAART